MANETFEIDAMLDVLGIKVFTSHSADNHKLVFTQSVLTDDGWKQNCKTWNIPKDVHSNLTRKIHEPMPHDVLDVHMHDIVKLMQKYGLDPFVE